MLDEGKKSIFDRPDVVVRQCTDNLEMDYDLSKPSTSKHVVREVIRVEDEFEASIDNSWIDISKKHKSNTNVINSIRDTMKLLQNKRTLRNGSRLSKKRNRSRSSSNDRYGKKHRSSSYYSVRNNDFEDLSHDRSTASSISSDESSSDHGYHSKKTNEYYNSKSERKRSSTPRNLSAKKLYRSGRSSRRTSRSRKHNRSSRNKSKNDDAYYDEIYEQYENNKMYMNCLQMNIAMQAIQALLEILTSANGRNLQ